jgi:hypothetical protein
MMLDDRICCHKGTIELNRSRSPRWKSYPMDIREQTFAGTYIIEEPWISSPEEAGSTRIPSNLSH